MSDVSVVALVLVSVWLGVLSLAVLLLIRQLGLVTVRLDRSRETAHPVNDGLDVGTPSPPAVQELLPEADGAPAYVLVLGTVCAPCRELLDDLRTEKLTNPVVALIAGREEMMDDVLALVPPGVKAVTGDAAADALRELEVSTTPMTFEIRQSTITGKAVLRGAEHFLGFIAGGVQHEEPHTLKVEEVAPHG